MLVVEGGIGCRGRRATGVATSVGSSIGEDLWANPGTSKGMRNEYCLKNRKHSHVAGICVDASIGESKSIVDDGLVIQHPSAHDPVPSNEALKMRADVDLLLVGVIGQVEVVSDRGIGGEVFDG